MRLKDLKYHILFLVFIAVCFVALNVIYFIGLNSNATEKSLAETESIYNNTLTRFDMQIQKIENDYEVLLSMKLEGTSTIVDCTSNVKDDYFSHFSGTTVAFSKMTDMEMNNNDTTMYLYLMSAIGGTHVAKYLATSLIDDAMAVKGTAAAHPCFIVDPNSFDIYASNQEYVSNSLFSILDENMSSRDLESIKKSLNKAIADNSLKSDPLSFECNLGGEKGFMAAKYYRNFLVFEFVTSSAGSLSNKSLTNLSIAYFAGIIILLVLTAVLVITMVARALGGSGLGSNSYRKTTNLIVIVNRFGKIKKTNRAFKTIFGGKKKAIKKITELQSVDGLNIKQEIKKQSKLIMSYTPEGAEPIFMEFLSVKHNHDFTLVGKDITDEYNDKLALEKVSTKSMVTGDPNGFVLSRRYREVKQQLKSVNTPYALAMINIKGFKEINNLLGFNQGNDVLCLLSDKINEIYTGSEVFHIGGDEFVCLGVNTDDNALAVKANELIALLRAPIKIGSNEIMLRPAIALFSSEMDALANNTYEDLITKLRLAVDRAKLSAGGSVSKYDINIENAAAKQREMEEDLKSAIAKGEFVMHYQPQWDLINDKVAGFEALLRWNNPKYQGISPQVYIEMAEKNGYIIDVGNFITSDVFKTVKEMEQYDIHISINVSPAQIVQAGFVADFIAEFEKNQLKNGSIAVEITETFIMENFASVVEKLKILKTRGISVHLDDFGTGYSSMLYLKELPIDTIKVDKEFVKHIESDKFSKILTSKIISLAKELGDKVICEGVETKVQKDILTKYGADIIQGYYVGKALSKEAAFEMLKTGKIAGDYDPKKDKHADPEEVKGAQFNVPSKKDDEEETVSDESSSEKE